MTKTILTILAVLTSSILWAESNMSQSEYIRLQHELTAKAEQVGKRQFNAMVDLYVLVGENRNKSSDDCLLEGAPLWRQALALKKEIRATNYHQGKLDLMYAAEDLVLCASCATYKPDPMQCFTFGSHLQNYTDLYYLSDDKYKYDLD